jgi:choline monooxygenase
VFEWFAPDPPADPRSDPKWKKLIELSDVTQDEDVAICEAVQRGLSSGRYRAGRYCERRENGVHHLHGLLHEHLRSH